MKITRRQLRYFILSELRTSSGALIVRQGDKRVKKRKPPSFSMKQAKALADIASQFLPPPWSTFYGMADAVYELGTAMQKGDRSKIEDVLTEQLAGIIIEKILMRQIPAAGKLIEFLEDTGGKKKVTAWLKKVGSAAASGVIGNAEDIASKSIAAAISKARTKAGRRGVSV